MKIIIATLCALLLIAGGALIATTAGTHKYWPKRPEPTVAAPVEAPIPVPMHKIHYGVEAWNHEVAVAYINATGGEEVATVYPDSLRVLHLKLGAAIELSRKMSVQQRKDARDELAHMTDQWSLEFQAAPGATVGMVTKLGGDFNDVTLTILIDGKSVQSASTHVEHGFAAVKVVVPK